MALGDIVEGIMILTTRWAEAKKPLPDLLAPTLLRYASHPSPALRALILRRLAYLQYHSPELGWQIFYRVFAQKHDQLWEFAEPCLYYAYHDRFDIVSAVLDEISHSTTEKSLETWGRISALAAFSSHINIEDLIARLQATNNLAAWQGASSVWAHTQNIISHPEQCFSGLRAGLKARGNASVSVARHMHGIFHASDSIVVVPEDIIDAYFSAIEGKASEDRISVYGFDRWLTALARNNPAEALTSAERFASFVRHSQYPWYELSDIAALLTRLFREAEEVEEADNGLMLSRVIALQDEFIAVGVNSLQDWLREAERP